MKQILEGRFIEGQTVTVNIDGDIITRKVRWSKADKDLYIIKDNMKYFYCEFLGKEWDMTIREARVEAGLTQQQVADLLEMPKRTLENWEEGKRKCPSYVEKLIVEKILSSSAR